MRKWIRFSLDNKFALLWLTLITAFAGIYSGLTMKRENIPDISLPYLTVTTVYPGASPESVMEEVTIPLEQQLAGVSSIRNILSTSAENISQILVEFDFGQDMDKAVNETREAVVGAKLPESALQPRIERFSFNSTPVISLGASAEGKSLEELTRFVEDVMRPELRGIEGVAEVRISGTYAKEVRLVFRPDAMARFGLNRETVEAVVKGSALKTPVGMYTIDGNDRIVVVDGRVTSIDDLGNLEIPVMTAMNEPSVPDADIPTVKLGEIAEIEIAGHAGSISRTNGKESIGIEIIKNQDANTVVVVNAVKAKIGPFEKMLDGLKLTVLIDQGEPIEHSLRTMLEKALYGGLFAVIVILLFLRNFRSTLIAAVSIPLSLLIAILMLERWDITLNIVTLGGMTVAIGRVVDDAIVVIENIYRRMTRDGETLRGKELIVEAAREVFRPILSSTIVTVAVFLPLGLVSGIVGELFMPFALAIVFALLASLLVSVTIVPMLAHLFFRDGLDEHRRSGRSSRPDPLAVGYRRVLARALRRKGMTFGLALLLLAGSFGLLPVIGVSFLTEEDQKYAMIAFAPQPGETPEAVSSRAMDAEKAILDARDPDLADMQFSFGDESPLQTGSSRSGLFFLKYRSDTKDFEDKKRAMLDRLRETVPEWEWSDLEGSNWLFGGNTFSVSVYGDKAEEIWPVAREIAELMRQDGRFEHVTSGLERTYGQLVISADQAKLARYGLTPGHIAMSLGQVRERPMLAKVSADGEVYPVYPEWPADEFRSAADLLEVKLVSPLGKEVPIGEVAEVTEGTAPNALTRANGRMVATVSGEIKGKDTGGVSDAFMDKVRRLDLPESVEVEAGGIAGQINESYSQLGMAMAAAIAIVYLVLVITFGGALAPLAVMFSLPFAIIGGLAALWIAGEPLSVPALMGALMLIGIVVTNAIVLIDRVINKEKEGLTTREALLEAAVTRLRPILMTAAATIGALLPLVFGSEGSGVISFGLAVTVIGGLISSTLLTLVIVPIVYETLMKLHRRRISQAGDSARLAH